MKIMTSLVGLNEHRRRLDWPADMPIPHVGDEVTLPDTGLGGPGVNLYVRRVIWYPEGDEGNLPFVYLVIGRTPRS